VIGGSDGKIYLANTADGKIVRTMNGHTSTVTGTLLADRHP
jgi:hypothetical protein